ncbi:sensor histidine kinase [Streptomyces inhibens]|uniref:sensor histidine kinase n=1 Tax=Streptomyces inhibens TaxID=2293571 RepID=UPI001EE6F0D3|nr:HAMP domain-containing sensor histidine kinase [Streptomyces inhibens]UKY47548.1 HAMP domain-containing histidine kinase [Streptomyces inhibens]
MRLSTRIAIVVGAVVPLLVVASGWVLVGLVTRDLRAQADQRLDERARTVATAARGLLRATSLGRPRAEQAHQRKLFSSALDVGFRLTGPYGTVMDGPQPGPAVRLPARTEHPVTVRSHGKTWRALRVPVNGSQAGVNGTLWLFSPDTASQAQIQLVRSRVITVAALAAPVSAALAWALAARAARPLRRLQQRTSGLDPHTTTARLEHTRTRITEVDDLAHTLQTFLARYDEQATRTAEALATARSFSAAASHELRTPLMSMQTNLDILDAFQDLDPADRAETVDDLRRGHARLLGLLVMLRALAQGDLVEADAFAPVDLADLADASVSDLRRTRHEAAVTLDSAPGLTVHGWQPGLRSLLDNLLANCLAHGRSADGRAHIAVTLRAAGDIDAPTAVLTVDDQGPGVPPEQWQTIFERFHRRSDSPGSGLGLTLVAQQIALHRAHLRVLNGPGGQGARFEITFPLTPADRPGAAVPVHRDWLSDTDQQRQEFHRERA